MVVSTAIAAIVVLQLTPRYTAEATMMLEARKNQVMDMQSLLSEMQGDVNVIRSEVEILKSRALAGKVVDKLNLSALPEFNSALAPAGFMNTLLQPVHWIVQSIKGGLDGASTASDAAANKSLVEQDRRTAIVNALMSAVDVTNDGRSYLLPDSDPIQGPRTCR